jgi:hypothetical protein
MERGEFYRTRDAATLLHLSQEPVPGIVCLLSDPLDPLLEGSERIVHPLSTVDPPKTGVLHRVIPKFGLKVVDKGIVRESSVQVHLFQKRLLTIG